MVVKPIFFKKVAASSGHTRTSGNASWRSPMPSPCGPSGTTCSSAVLPFSHIASAKATGLHAEVCQGEEYNGHGFSITSAQTQNAGVHDFTQSLHTAAGCDSTVTLHLTVNAPATTTIDESVCKGGIYYGHGFFVATKDSLPGTYSYTQSLLSADGCDSIVTLNLTVDQPIETNINDAICHGGVYSENGFNIRTKDSVPGTYTYTISR